MHWKYDLSSEATNLKVHQNLTLVFYTVTHRNAIIALPEPGTAGNEEEANEAMYRDSETPEK